MAIEPSQDGLLNIELQIQTQANENNTQNVDYLWEYSLIFNFFR